jgi:DNA-binding MarR family transcriptional regulator
MTSRVAEARPRVDGAVPRAWVQMLRVHATTTNEMDARLRSAHGLTLTEYEVLLLISWAPDVGMRPVDLARAALLSQGGITRLLVRLEQAGLVQRSASAHDGRVVYARLTKAGDRVLHDAASTHIADVNSLFADRLSKRQLTVLADLLGLLPGGDVGIDLKEHPVRPA